MISIPMRLTLVLAFLTPRCQPKILRNNALMNKMVSHFQKDNNKVSHLMEHRARHEERKVEDIPHRDIRAQAEQGILSMTGNKSPPVDENDEVTLRKRDRILNLMQNVLCKNFPAIPCSMIMQDDALNKLFDKSIQQIAYKHFRPREVESTSAHGVTFPVINSEDLSNFLEVSNTGYFEAKKKKEEKVKRKKLTKTQNHWSHEKLTKKKEKLKGKQETKRPEMFNNGRKKMRKFYPHKVKYKDGKSQNGKGEYREYSEEKFSMSVELPDMKPKKAPILEIKDQMEYKMEPQEQPVWRIDYMKHGIPSLNTYGFDDDRLSGKLIKPGPNGIVAEHINEAQAQPIRKEVLHPDVYIKKNFARKGGVTFNSEAMD